MFKEYGMIPVDKPHFGSSQVLHEDEKMEKLDEKSFKSDDHEVHSSGFELKPDKQYSK